MLQNLLFKKPSSGGLPTEETFLWNEEDVAIPSDPTFTVPDGVTVLKLSMQVQENTGENDYFATLMVMDFEANSNYLEWGSCMAWSGETAESTVYVGVTPNKGYTLWASLSTNQDGICNYLRISYSASINQQTPTVTDY